MPHANLKACFDRVVVINLDRRPERWHRFVEQLTPGWPFAPPLRFSAIDGRKSPEPSWWRVGSGAWGCFQSHLQILKDCLNEGIESVLVLEDDARLSPTFDFDVRSFFSELPEDWQLIFLGGQHIELPQGLPEQVSRNVYRPFNVNRLHAYAIRSRAMLEKVVAHLSDWRGWKPDHHVDHHMGELQKLDRTGMYVPGQWLVAQAKGDSDICNSDLTFRVFQGAEDLVHPVVDLPMVAVVGAYESGASEVAEIVHGLGVSMGRSFDAPENTKTCGEFEARGLAYFASASFAEPWLTEQVPRPHRQKLLEIWAADQCRAFKSGHRLVGAKHPLLCLMGPELWQAWHQPRLLVVDRDTKAMINSMVNRKWGWPVEACMMAMDQLIAAREHFLAAYNPPYLRINYEELLRDRPATIRAIRDFLGINSSMVQPLQTTQKG